MSDFFDFSGAEVNNDAGGVIPAGTVAWAIVSFRNGNANPVPSKATPGNAYLDVELTICEGPYNKRKVWDMIGVEGTEQYKNMGRSAIRAMLESGRNASEQNPAGYKIGGFQDLAGMRVAIKVKVEKGTSGYQDKNRPIYITPNPQSNTAKDFQKLVEQSSSAASGVGNVGYAAPNTGMPSQPGAPQQAPDPSWQNGPANW